jgi:retinol dehydrogenase-12
MEVSGVIALCVILPIAFIVFLILLKICYINGPMNKQTSDITGKIIIVTGASSGIGKLTADHLLEKGAIVIFACRNEAKTMALISTLKHNRHNAHFVQLDLGDVNSVLRFSKEFRDKFEKCDILINNAGSWYTGYSETSGVETTFMCNHIGPVILTAMLLPCMTTNSRVINLSSMLASMLDVKAVDKLTSGGINANTNYALESYSLSKLSNLYHAQYLSSYFHSKSLNIKACSLHPGAVNTEFSNGFQSCVGKFVCCLFHPVVWYFYKSPWVGTQTTLHCVHVSYDKLSDGGYYSDCKEVKLNGHRTDKKKMTELMEYTKNVVYKQFEMVPDEVHQFFSL